MPNLCLNVVLLGKTGAGINSTGNTILRRQAFISRKSPKSVTQDVSAELGEVCGIPITVYDTPGFSGTESKDHLWKYQEVLQKCETGPCVFLLVLQVGRFTEEEREIVEKIEELLGEKHLKNTWILFTRGDQLNEENMTIQEFISQTEPLKKLNQKYEGRCHVFNNKHTEEPGDQMQSLIFKVIQRNKGNLSRKPQQRIPVNIHDIPVDSRSSRRIVLLGKSGFGKSAAGNTILGQKVFRSERRMISVTTECSEKQAIVSDRSVSVVDTPGFFDTQMNPEELAEKIARSVYLSSPGPHAFLIVFRVTDRFTEQEEKIPQITELMFGEDVLKYSIILFTHGDQLDGESVADLINESKALKHLVDQCGGRFHIFNNKDQNNREQVNDLLQKIDTMIEQNGGHYSNQMFEDAQRYRREEEERRKREEEERKQQEEKQREEEGKRINEEIERVGKETEKRVRAEMETQRCELERLKAMRQKEEGWIKQQEKQKQEEIERVIKETEKKIREEMETKYKFELLKAERESKTKERKEQGCNLKQVEIKKLRKEKIRAECVTQQRSKWSESTFQDFFFQYLDHFYWAVIGGAVIGGAVGGAVGGPVGGVVGAVVGGVGCVIANRMKGGTHTRSDAYRGCSEQ